MGLDLPEPRIVDLDGPVRYRAWDGPEDTTFVLLHGLGGTHLNWVQAAPGLAGLGRVLALDLSGFGGTPRAGRGSGLMDQRRLVSAFARELGTGRVILGGNSMGGAVAMLAAAVEPEAAGGLILTSSVFPWARGGAPHPVILTAFAAYRSPVAGEWLVRRRFGVVDAERAVRLSMRMIAADPSTVPDELIDLMAAEIRARAKVRRRARVPRRRPLDAAPRTAARSRRARWPPSGARCSCSTVGGTGSCRWRSRRRRSARTRRGAAGSSATSATCRRSRRRGGGWRTSRTG